MFRPAHAFPADPPQCTKMPQPVLGCGVVGGSSDKLMGNSFRFVEFIGALLAAILIS